MKKLRVNANDFEQKKVIGRGHFGEVSLVREKQTGNVYAMKVMKKSATLARSNVGSIHLTTSSIYLFISKDESTFLCKHLKSGIRTERATNLEKYAENAEL